MMRCIVAVVALVWCAAESRAQQQPRDCAVPGYLLFGDSTLRRVNEAVTKSKRLKIAVVGTTSSTLPGRDGADNAYPAKLEAALKGRLPGVAVTVATHAKPRQTASQIDGVLEKVLLDEKPNLVVLQTGTYDALQGIDPEHFRASVADGVETLQAGGADVILMNMQYSPRTESTIALGGYADNMRWVAREREVPLFDRLAIMRHWYDSGMIDLYAATKDVGLAKRVHECIGRALASMVIDAARLEAFESKASR
jgi:lysophospholipase L1-like esterase